MCMYTYIYMYASVYIWRYLIVCFDEGQLQQVCTSTFVLTNFEYMHACIHPAERSEARSERRDEARGSKLHIAQTKART